jgi:hypothetical protein
LQAGKGGDGGAPVRVVAWLDLQGQQSKLKSQTNQEIKNNYNKNNNKNK